MSVNQRRANRRTFKQTEIACRGFRQASAERRAGRDDLISDFRVILRGKIAKTDALEITSAPALFVGQEIPLTSERAY